MEKFGGFFCKAGNVPLVFPNGRKRPRGKGGIYAGKQKKTH